MLPDAQHVSELAVLGVNLTKNASTPSQPATHQIMRGIR